MDYYLRPVSPDDAADLSAIRRMPGVFETITGIVTERVERTKRRLAEMDENTHQLVAVIKGESNVETVVAKCGIKVDKNPRRRHCANLTVLVHGDYQNCGIGSKLLESILDVADNWLMLVRVELNVAADNERAIHLYEKFGFVNEGTRRCYTIRNGKYVDHLIMARIRNVPMPSST